MEKAACHFLSEVVCDYKESVLKIHELLLKSNQRQAEWSR